MHLTEIKCSGRELHRANVAVLPLAVLPSLSFSSALHGACRNTRQRLVTRHIDRPGSAVRLYPIARHGWRFRGPRRGALRRLNASVVATTAPACTASSRLTWNRPPPCRWCSGHEIGQEQRRSATVSVIPFDKPHRGEIS